MKKIVLTCDNNREYIVKNPMRFIQHLKKFHTENGKGDNSIHEENGYYFTVTSDFFESVKKLFNSK